MSFDDERSALEKGQDLLVRLSRTTVDGSAALADESDRWVLRGLYWADRGMRSALSEVVALGHYVVRHPVRERIPLLRSKSARERIRDALLREARRAGGQIPEEQLQEFAEKISILVELVLGGTIGLECIAFESDDPTDAEGETPQAAE